MSWLEGTADKAFERQEAMRERVKRYDPRLSDYDIRQVADIMLAVEDKGGSPAVAPAVKEYQSRLRS